MIALSPEEAVSDLRRIGAIPRGDFGPTLGGPVTTRFYQGIKDTYHTERTPEYGNPWQELSPAYKKWKDRKYPGRQILELTGDMMASATGQNASDRRIEPHSAHYWVPQEYAAVHQFGSGRIPRRRFFGASEETLDDIQDIITEEVTRRIA